MASHTVVSHEEWLAARRELLENEKTFTRQCDEMSLLQRSLPWEAVTKIPVRWARREETLRDLFAGRSQLVVYHFMFHPDDKAGCPHCSLRADGFAGIGVHLNHRDVTMVVVSSAPYEKLAAYQRRMGWRFKWLSSGASDFNVDYQVSFTRPGERRARDTARCAIRLRPSAKGTASSSRARQVPSSTRIRATTAATTS